jgi:hypothetical protein
MPITIRSSDEGVRFQEDSGSTEDQATGGRQWLGCFGEIGGFHFLFWDYTGRG